MTVVPLLICVTLLNLSLPHVQGTLNANNMPRHMERFLGTMDDDHFDQFDGEGSLPSKLVPIANNDPSLDPDAKTTGRTTFKGRAAMGFGLALAVFLVIASLVYYYKYVSKQRAQDDSEDGADKAPYTNPAEKEAASSLGDEEATVLSEAPSNEELDLDHIA